MVTTTLGRDWQEVQICKSTEKQTKTKKDTVTLLGSLNYGVRRDPKGFIVVKLTLNENTNRLLYQLQTSNNFVYGKIP